MTRLVVSFLQCTLLIAMLLFTGCSYYASYRKLGPYFESKETWPVKVNEETSGFALVGIIVPVFPVFPGKDHVQIVVNDLNGICPVLIRRNIIYEFNNRAYGNCFYDVVNAVEGDVFQLQWNDKVFRFKLQMFEFSEYRPYPYLPT